MNRLSDFVSGSGGTALAEIALLISFVAFLGILAYVVFRRKGAWDRARRLPLDDTRPDDGTPAGRESDNRSDDGASAPDDTTRS